MISVGLLSTLSGVELKVLIYLMKFEGSIRLTQEDIAFALNIDQRGVGRALKTLNNMELIEYKPHNYSKKKSEINVRLDNFDTFCNLS